MRGLFVILLIAYTSAVPVSVQSADGLCGNDKDQPHGRENVFLKHLDAAVTGGTTGIGLDLAAPLVKNVQLRIGMSFMPNVDFNMDFGLETYTANGITGSRLEKMAEFMEFLSGCEIDDQIRMKGEPKYYNFKLLVDIFPFKSKKWHLTAGFYWGSSTVAKAVNITEESTSLVAVKMYNNLYDYIMGGDYWDKPVYNDFYLDPDVAEQLAQRLTGIGRVGVNIGTKVSDGTPYMLEPDGNGMMSTKVKTNSFKPYFGFGYGHAIGGGSKDRTFNVSFDCGLMFWGGTPEIITHDGVNLAKDVSDVKGKVGDYVKIIKAFKVFPVMDLRVAYRIF